jgi:AraC family transcriptional activator of tynA and feaB
MAQTSSPIQRWSTDDVPQGLRFDYWSGILSQSLTPMSVGSDDPRHFAASLTEAPMGAISVIEQDGSAHVSHRSAHDVELSEHHSYHLLVSLNGPWDLTHGDRSRLRPGDVVLADSNLGHHIELRSAYHFVNLKLPPRWLHTWIPDAGQLVGRRISRNSDAGRALSSFICRLTPQFAAAAPIDGRLLSDHVGALLAMVSGEFDQSPREQRGLLRRIRDCMAQRCHEPGLSAADVAQSLAIPERLVHRALASIAATFASLLLELRFDLGVRQCGLPAFSELSTEDVGRQAGFSNPGQFVRMLAARRQRIQR